MTEYHLMNKNRKLVLFTISFDEAMGEYDCDEVEIYVEQEV